MFVEPYDYDDDRPWGPGCLLGLAAIAMPWVLGFCAWACLFR